MKKSMAFVSAATMALSMCTGWQAAAMADEASEPVTISWYRQAWHANEDEKLVEDAINEYIEPLIGVNVKLMNASENTDLFSGDLIM